MWPACVSVAIIVAHEKRGVGTIQDAFLFCFVYERLSVTSVTSMFDVALGHTEKSLRKEAINAGYFDPMAQQWSSISLF